MSRYLQRETVYNCSYCPYFKPTWFRIVYPLASSGGCKKGNFEIYDCHEKIPEHCPLERDAP